MPLGAGTAAGAAGGAQAGMAFGPWGALIGGVAGALLGSLGPGGPKTRPWVDVPKSPEERVANQLDKNTWRQLLTRYAGAPEPVLSTYGAMRSAYPTADALSEGGGPTRYSGALESAIAANQDPLAKGVNAQTGWGLHNWAMQGKLASGARRQSYQNSIASMQMANKVHNAALQAQYDAGQRALWAQAGQSALGLAGGLYGAYGGGSAPTASSVPHIGLTPGSVTPSPYSWQGLVGNSLRQPSFQFSYGG